MSFTPEQNAALSAPLDRANVASRQQAVLMAEERGWI